MSIDAAREVLGERLVKALATGPSPAAATEAALREIALELGWALCTLWVLDERAGLLRFGADWAADERLRPLRDAARRLSFSAGTGLPGAVLETGRPRWIPDVAGAPHFPRAEVAQAVGIRCAVGVPVAAAEGLLGVLEACGSEPRPEDPRALADLTLPAAQLAVHLARMRVEDRLSASEERGASIVRAALDCIVTMDHEGRVVDFNPAAEATFGYAREEVVGALLADRIIPPELREAHRTALGAYVESGRPTILDRRLELTGMRSDGSTFPVELTVARLGTGEPPAFAGFLRDITDRVRAEDERERLLRDTETARELAQEAGRRLALLAQAGARMLASRDPEATMQQVAEIAVPAVADWCSVTVVEPGGGLRTLGTAHADPALDILVRELVRRHPPRPDGPAGPAAVIRTGRTELLEEIPDELLQRVARDDEHLGVLRRLKPRAMLTVPLRTPTRVFGALLLAMAGSGRSFATDDVSLAESLGARAALAIENARLFQERSTVAETLQQSLLPARLPHAPGLDIAARYRPAGEANLVGGDFYDVFPTGDGAWAAVLGDVAGKGAEAAARTALTRHTLRAGALREPSPRANLQLLNEALLAHEGRHGLHFATAIFAQLCPRDGAATVTVSSGGHPPPLLVHPDATIEYLPVQGTVLGAVDEVELQEVEARLAPGDLLLLYTDGVTELRPFRSGAGERLLEDVARRHAGGSAEALVAGVEAAVVAAQDGEPRDDIALVAVGVA